jgi:agmatine/peptidylarginine deiminase
MFVLVSLASLLPPALAQNGGELGAALPRWREGGTPPDDPGRALVPFAVRGRDLGAGDTAPTSGTLASPLEYGPIEGVLFRYSTTSHAAVVTACVAGLTGDPQHDEIAYVVVASSSQASSAATAFQNAGADLSKVIFIVEATNSIWIRDYGPHFVWQSGTRVISDSHYYPSRPTDNFIPTRLAGGTFVEPAYAMGLYYSGGNFQPGPSRSGFVTSLVQQDNPDLSLQQIADLYRIYQGIDTLHVLPRLPATVDSTGHIDMWLYLVDDRTAIVSQFKAGSNATAIQITEDAVPYLEGLGFTVFRTPAWNANGTSGTHYTYSNAFRVNDRIFVPIYGPGNANYLDEDQAALAAWQAAAGPGVTLVPINCYTIIPQGGAIHCIVMQVPRYVGATPSVHVLAPAGGELLARHQTVDLAWSADDDQEIASVDLAYSLDGGLTYPHPIASGLPDSGHFTWTVPAQSSLQARVRATAHDGAGNSAEGVSAGDFELAKGVRRVHDFSSGAGLDKWAYGYQSASWSELAGVRRPASVATPIELLRPGAIAALAASDATGGDSDPARYIAPAPGASSESTHVFEFLLDEDLASLLDIELRWEGYGDECLQMEMYVWDDTAQDWSDARGTLGANAYVANWAGNVDGELVGHITRDFARYLDPSGKLTLLLYGERNGQESFCDYVAVTTTSRPVRSAGQTPR